MASEKKIGGRTFRTEPALATEVIRLQIRLAKLIGPAAGGMESIFGGEGRKKDTEASFQAAGVSALSRIVAEADEEDWLRILHQVAGMAEVQAQSGTWDQVEVDAHFTGRSSDMIPFVTWVLREQLGDFFTAFQGIIALAKEKAEASQTTKSAA